MRGNFDMIIQEKQNQWLESNFPNLLYNEKDQKIVGELDFCAYYEKRTGELIFGNIEDIGTQYTFIQDVFEIEIRLGPDARDQNGWPVVYEIGGRHAEIARKCQVPIIDLHIYESDGACCLGISIPLDGRLRIEWFILHLIIPFFYRLSYTEKFGISAARNDLWDEYAHGDEGVRQYIAEIVDISKFGADRNQPCPCGSGRKYKKCHLGEVEAMDRLL